MSIEIRFVHSPYTFEGMVPVAIRQPLSNGQTSRIVRPGPVCAPRTYDSIMSATIRTLQTQNQKTQPRPYSPQQQAIAAQPMMSFGWNPLITVRSPSMVPLAMPFALPSMPSTLMNVIPTPSAEPHCCHHSCSSPECQSPSLSPFPARSPPSLHGSETSGEVLGTDSCPSEIEILSSSSVATPTAKSQKETVRMLPSPHSPSSAAASSIDSEGEEEDDHDDEKSGAGRERHVKMGREYHRGKALMLGCPCEHIAQWKRLRAKRGYSHFLCQLCGNKWKKSKFLSF